MKRIISILFFVIAIFSVNAQVTAESIINGVISRYNTAKSISANIHISSMQENITGSVIMQGRSFKLNSTDVKSWYNGKDQWTYTKASGEVSLISPTPEELQASNPYSAILSLKNGYKSHLLRSTSANEYSLKFVPRIKSNEIKELHINVSKSNLMVNKIILVMTNGTTITTHINNYKLGNTLNQNIFVFNKNEVPKGTPVVDLR